MKLSIGLNKSPLAVLLNGCQALGEIADTLETKSDLASLIDESLAASCCYEGRNTTATRGRTDRRRRTSGRFIALLQVAPAIENNCGQSFVKWPADSKFIWNNGGSGTIDISQFCLARVPIHPNRRQAFAKRSRICDSLRKLDNGFSAL